ncbi:MAG TPA: bifunctional enoyl-CoA hydratase/phosphate acetyltransferase [Tissierellia bacterium]|jgi:phosphate butyryltransferase|nr:bifunctional enoyl-CoA hydratase/phosphate acetyltransferase [Tissierellia bacterium]
MIRHFETILEEARKSQGVRIAVANGANDEVLEAVDMAHREGIVEAILVGDSLKTKEIMQQHGINPDEYTFVEASSLQECAKKAVQLVHDGKAQILMKGLVDTGILMKEVLNKEYGLRKSSLLSHVAVQEVPRYHKLLVITDAAMNIAPNVEQKAEIIRNAMQVTRALQIEEPKVALLAAKEKVDEKMPCTVDAKALKEMDFPGAIVDGPFALDNAISKESARIKGLDSSVAGDADILLAPDIEAGNILYKTLNFLVDTKGAGILVGAASPIVLTSRADDEPTKLHSIALAVLMSQVKED